MKKEEGNTLYKLGEFEAAREKYLEGLEYVRNEIGEDAWTTLLPLYSNLSLIGMKLENWVDVVRYTEKILKKDGNNVKALFRRAQGKLRLGYVEHSKQDIVKAIGMEPNSLEMRKLYEEVKAQEQQCL